MPDDNGYFDPNSTAHGTYWRRSFINSALHLHALGLDVRDLLEQILPERPEPLTIEQWNSQESMRATEKL